MIPVTVEKGKKPAVFILTFNRPEALNRQIDTWGKGGYDVCVFSNHPEVRIRDPELPYVKEVFINNLSYAESNSYCARSWNQMFIRAFHVHGLTEAVFVQDDTLCDARLPLYVKQERENFDFLWGPAGDQFFFMKLDVLKKVGWFDERFLGCYCGDADFVKRVALNYDNERLAIEELHDWGFIINNPELSYGIPTNIQCKACDENYINQDQENQVKAANGTQVNVALEQSWKHFKAKWGAPGNGINGIGSTLQYKNQLVDEVDWYPWFTKKYLRG